MHDPWEKAVREAEKASRWARVAMVLAVIGMLCSAVSAGIRVYLYVAAPHSDAGCPAEAPEK